MTDHKALSDQQIWTLRGLVTSPLGGSDRTRASLRKRGLIEGVGTQVRVTEAGRAVLAAAFLASRFERP